MKKIIAIVLNIIYCTAFMISGATAAESGQPDYIFNNVSEWSGSSAAASRLTLNTDANYCKNGDTSLCLSYPESASGSTYNITSTNWKNGGFQLPVLDSEKILTKIGMWVYMSEADSNIKINLRTRTEAASTITDSEAVLLDFEGWRFLTFDVNRDTKFIYSITVKKVQSAPNISEKFIYFDSVSIVYDYDPSMKQELTMDSSIKDGAREIKPQTSKIICTFSNPIDENKMFSVDIIPKINFSVTKTDAKTYNIYFPDALEGDTEYSINFSNITDVYSQTMESAIKFSTSATSISINSVKNNEEDIAEPCMAKKGSLEINANITTVSSDYIGKLVWLVCGIYDNANKMIGLNMKPIVFEKNMNVDMKMEISDTPASYSIFLIDSLEKRNIIQSMD